MVTQAFRNAWKTAAVGVAVSVLVRRIAQIENAVLIQCAESHVDLAQAIKSAAMKEYVSARTQNVELYVVVKIRSAIKAHVAPLTA